MFHQHSSEILSFSLGSIASILGIFVVVLFWFVVVFKISADADGGPRSRVCTAGHSAQPPIDVSEKISAHVSA